MIRLGSSHGILTLRALVHVGSSHKFASLCHVGNGKNQSFLNSASRDELPDAEFGKVNCNTHYSNPWYVASTPIGLSDSTFACFR